MRCSTFRLFLATAAALACWATLLFGASAQTTSPALPSDPQAPAVETEPGTTTPEAEIVPAAALPDVAAVATGLSHTCALNTGGAVLCWGDNTYGQLGAGGRSLGAGNPFPRTVMGFESGVKAIAAGDVHTCALTAEGWVKCWGSNAFGQLGPDAPVTQGEPITVTGLISGVQQIAAGGSHTCALTAAGSVQCWGDFSPTPATVPGLTSGVQQIAAGYAHTCAVTAAGGVQCWGANDTGQLGDGSTTSSATPVNVQGLGSGVKAVAAGGAPVDRFTRGGHTCALSTGGSVQCWGANTAGQLGDDTTTNRLTPVNVAGLGSGVTSITAGDAHTCAISGEASAGTSSLRCWGDNRYGQLGVGSTENYTTPVQVGGFTSGVQAVDAGGAHTCAATAAGALKCWGRNASGQIGNFTVGAQSLLPVNVLVPEGLVYLPQVWREAAAAAQ